MSNLQLGSKVILFINNFVGPGIGGGEQHLILLAKASREAGYKVIIGCVPGSDTGRVFSALGFRIVGLKQSGLGLLRTIVQIRALVAEEQVEIVHACGFLPGNLARLALGPSKLDPLIVTSILCQPDSTKWVRQGFTAAVMQWVRNAGDRFTMRWGDLFIACSLDIKNQLLKLGIPIERVVLIHNGIDIGMVAERAKAAATPAAGKGATVGVIGRLEPVKGVSYLLEAMSHLRTKRPSLRLAVVGDGALKHELYREAEALGLGDRVDFLGYVDDPMVVMANLDVYALPSLSEGFNITLLEALALARPVVATDVGGNRELIKDGETGLLVAPRDPEALAAAIGQLLDDPQSAAAMGQAGAKLVREKFSAQAMCSKMFAVYDRFLKKKHRFED